MADATWTKEADALLRALWARPEMSAARIGAEIGCTKNAVVGRAHRLDLPARPSPIRRADPAAARAAPKPKPVGRAATLPAALVRALAPTPSAALVVATAPAVAEVPALAVPRAPAPSRRSCQWIEGEPRGPATVFCGAPAVPGCSWCCAHRKRVFTTRIPDWAA